VFIPAEALKVDDPDYSGIRCYWLCRGEHSQLQPEDEAITTALQTLARSAKT
jgi:hypothetical protein